MRFRLLLAAIVIFVPRQGNGSLEICWDNRGCMQPQGKGGGYELVESLSEPLWSLDDDGTSLDDEISTSGRPFTWTNMRKTCEKISELSERYNDKITLPRSVCSKFLDAMDLAYQPYPCTCSEKIWRLCGAVPAQSKKCHDQMPVLFTLRADKVEEGSRSDFLRMLLAHAGVQYNDMRVSWDGRWSLENPPDGLPALLVDSNMIDHPGNGNNKSPLMVARYIAKEFGLAGRNETESASAEASVKGCLNFIYNALVPYYWARVRKQSQRPHKEKIEKVALPNFLNQVVKELDDNGGGFLVGSGITYSDICVASTLDGVIRGLPDVWTKVLEPKHVKAVAHMNMVFGQHNIKKWAEIRRMQIYLRLAHVRETRYEPYALEVEPSDTIEKVKAKIQSLYWTQFEVPYDQCCRREWFIYSTHPTHGWSAQEFTDVSKTLSEYNVKEGDTITDIY